MYLEPHDYRIYYVNIDLRHQYGISAAESQMFLLAKRPGSEERGEMDVFAGLSHAVTVNNCIKKRDACRVVVLLMDM